MTLKKIERTSFAYKIILEDTDCSMPAIFAHDSTRITTWLHRRPVGEGRGGGIAVPEPEVAADPTHHVGTTATRALDGTRVAGQTDPVVTLERVPAQPTPV